MGTGDDQRHAGPSDASLRALSEFLRTEREEILSRVESAVRALPERPGAPAATAVDPEALLDVLPGVFDRVAESADPAAAAAAGAGSAGEGDGAALERTEWPLDLRGSVMAHALLREAMLGLAFERARPGGAGPLVGLLDQAVDRALGAAVERFVSSHHRGWRALERILEVPLPPGAALEEGLRLLLEAFSAVVTTADTAAVLVREDDGRPSGEPGRAARPRLRLRAAAGAEEPLWAASAATTQSFGEGFDGGIAERRQPALVRWAAREVHEGAPRVGGLVLRALYGLPLFHDGEVVGVVHMGSLTAFDFSAQDRRLLAALGARAQALIAAERARAAGLHAGRFRDELVPPVAHDLRGPLGVIQLQAGLLDRAVAGRTGALPAKVTRVCRAILRAGERLGWMIGDLSDYARLGGGRLRLAIEPAPAAELLDQAVQAMTLVARDRGAVLEADLPAHLPEICCDRNRVVLVLLKLLDQALAASGQGGRVSARARPEGEEEAAAAVRFSIQDSGVAVAAEQTARLFEPASVRSGRRAGVLGLAAARGIVEAHGGRMWAEAAHPGAPGMVIHFTIPARRG